MTVNGQKHGKLLGSPRGSHTMRYRATRADIPTASSTGGQYQMATCKLRQQPPRSRQKQDAMQATSRGYAQQQQLTSGSSGPLHVCTSM